MTEWQMIDPTGALIVATRDYLDDVAAAEPTSRRGLAAIAIGDAVYGGEKAEDRSPPYVLFQRAGPTRRMPRAPVARIRYQVKCYGLEPSQATTVYMLVSDALQAKMGPRRRSAGVAIYLSTEELGGQASIDPDTDEPLEVAFFFVSVPLAQA